MEDFKFKGTELRAVEEGGRWWFVAQDVCECLGLLNPSMVVETQVKSPSHQREVKLETKGGPQDFLAVNDLGLYAIILASRKPVAKEFEAWISGTVFPKLGLKAPDQD